MKYNKLSVVTVCFNAANEIEKTILSVLSQEDCDIEYIVIDGKSKDNTVDIIKKYQGKIDKWISEPDNGLYDAMNKGIEMASGDWICFMNAGDVFVNNNVVSEVFKQNIPDNTGVIYGDVVLDYSPYGYVLKRMNNLKGEQVALGVCHQATLTRAAILKEMKYDLSYKIFADINAFYIMWKKGIVYTYVPVKMALFEAFDGISNTKVFDCFKESARFRGIKWYSFKWWKGLFTACMKKAMNVAMDNEDFRRNKYKRILSKYEPYNL